MGKLQVLDLNGYDAWCVHNCRRRCSLILNFGRFRMEIWTTRCSIVAQWFSVTSTRCALLCEDWISSIFWCFLAKSKPSVYSIYYYCHVRCCDRRRFARRKTSRAFSTKHQALQSFLCYSNRWRNSGLHLNGWNCFMVWTRFLESIQPLKLSSIFPFFFSFS